MRSLGQRRELRLASCLLFFFALVYAKAADDPCPLHGDDYPHGLGASVTGQGVVCHCVLIFFCSFSFSLPFDLAYARGWINIPFSDRKTRLWALEIFHPPRFLPMLD